MATYNKFQAWAENMVEVANCGTDTFKVMLTNSPGPSATDSVKADLTEISAGNGYTAGGTQATISSSAQTGGTYKLTLNDVVFTASGGTIGPFRYVVLYDDTPTSPADPLVAYWDYGSSITLNDTETFTADLDAANGVFTVA